jgi:cytochrome c biogenesis protein CcmG, thiol:disulfide interchange protein DsbE
MAFVSTWQVAARFVAVVATACATGAHAAQVAQVDRPAPELDVRLLSGKLLKAKELRGKVVMNVIWATWSPAARMELPEVQRLYRALRDKGLEVVALSIDENPGEVREFWRKRAYSFPVAMRSDAFFNHYGRVSTTPMFYIVDRQGTLRYRVAGTVGPEKLEALLKPLLAEPPPAASVAKK